MITLSANERYWMRFARCLWISPRMTDLGVLKMANLMDFCDLCKSYIGRSKLTRGAEYLYACCKAEFDRRSVDYTKPADPEPIRLCADAYVYQPATLSDLLTLTATMQHLPLPKVLCEFVNQLHLHVVACATAVLDDIAASTK